MPQREGNLSCAKESNLSSLRNVQSTALQLEPVSGYLIFHFPSFQSAGPQCIAPGFPIEDEKKLMPGMILSDGKTN